MNPRLSVDRHQLSQLIVALRQPQRHGLDLSKVLQLLQAAALVLGGCWAFFQYLTFQKTLNADRIAQSKIELARSDVELELRKLEVGLKSVEGDMKSQEFETAKSVNFSRTISIDVKPLEEAGKGLRAYSVAYGFSLENTGKAAFEVSGVITDYYIGAVKTAGVRRSAILPLGTPANRWNPSSEVLGAINWKRLNTVSSVISMPKEEIASPWDYVIDETSPVHGGGLSGTWQPGQSAQNASPLIVYAKPGSYIGIGTSVCFNGCSKNEDLYWRWDYVALDEAKENASNRETLLASATEKGVD
jgi:hypothetical protein